MEMIELSNPQRKVLLSALDFDLNNLKCQICGKKTTYDKCSIFQPTDTKLTASIICESILCLSAYFTKLEE